MSSAEASSDGYSNDSFTYSSSDSEADMPVDNKRDGVTRVDEQETPLHAQSSTKREASPQYSSAVFHERSTGTLSELSGFLDSDSAHDLAIGGHDAEFEEKTDVDNNNDNNKNGKDIGDSDKSRDDHNSTSNNEVRNRIDNNSDSNRESRSKSPTESDNRTKSNGNLKHQNLTYETRVERISRQNSNNNNNYANREKSEPKRSKNPVKRPRPVSAKVAPMLSTSAKRGTMYGLWNGTKTRTGAQIVKVLGSKAKGRVKRVVGEMKASGIVVQGLVKSYDGSGGLALDVATSRAVEIVRKKNSSARPLSAILARRASGIAAHRPSSAVVRAFKHQKYVGQIYEQRRNKCKRHHRDNKRTNVSRHNIKQKPPLMPAGNYDGIPTYHNSQYNNPQTQHTYNPRLLDKLTVKRTLDLLIGPTPQESEIQFTPVPGVGTIGRELLVKMAAKSNGAFEFQRKTKYFKQKHEADKRINPFLTPIIGGGGIGEKDRGKNSKVGVNFINAKQYDPLKNTLKRQEPNDNNTKQQGPVKNSAKQRCNKSNTKRVELFKNDEEPVQNRIPQLKNNTKNQIESFNNGTPLKEPNKNKLGMSEHRRQRPKYAPHAVSKSLDGSMEKDPEVLRFEMEVQQNGSNRIEMAVNHMKNGNIPEATRVLYQAEEKEEEELTDDNNNNNNKNNSNNNKHPYRKLTFTPAVINTDTNLSALQTSPQVSGDTKRPPPINARRDNSIPVSELLKELAAIATPPMSPQARHIHQQQAHQYLQDILTQPTAHMSETEIEKADEDGCEINDSLILSEKGIHGVTNDQTWRYECMNSVIDDQVLADINANIVCGGRQTTLCNVSGIARALFATDQSNGSIGGAIGDIPGKSEKVAFSQKLRSMIAVAQLDPAQQQKLLFTANHPEASHVKTSKNIPKTSSNTNKNPSLTPKLSTKIDPIVESIPLPAPIHMVHPVNFSQASTLNKVASGGNVGVKVSLTFDANANKEKAKTNLGDVATSVDSPTRSWKGVSQGVKSLGVVTHLKRRVLVDFSDVSLQSSGTFLSTYSHLDPVTENNSFADINSIATSDPVAENHSLADINSNDDEYSFIEADFDGSSTCVIHSPSSIVGGYVSGNEPTEISDNTEPGNKQIGQHDRLYTAGTVLMADGQLVSFGLDNNSNNNNNNNNKTKKTEDSNHVKMYDIPPFLALPTTHRDDSTVALKRRDSVSPPPHETFNVATLAQETTLSATPAALQATITHKPTMNIPTNSVLTVNPTSADISSTSSDLSPNPRNIPPKDQSISMIPYSIMNSVSKGIEEYGERPPTRRGHKPNFEVDSNISSNSKSIRETVTSQVAARLVGQLFGCKTETDDNADINSWCGSSRRDSHFSTSSSVVSYVSPSNAVQQGITASFESFHKNRMESTVNLVDIETYNEHDGGDDWVVGDQECSGLDRETDNDERDNMKRSQSCRSMRRTNSMNRLKEVEEECDQSTENISGHGLHELVHDEIEDMLKDNDVVIRQKELIYQMQRQLVLQRQIGLEKEAGLERQLDLERQLNQERNNAIALDQALDSRRVRVDSAFQSEIEATKPKKMVKKTMKKKKTIKVISPTKTKKTSPRVSSKKPAVAKVAGIKVSKESAESELEHSIQSGSLTVRQKSFHSQSTGDDATLSSVSASSAGAVARVTRANTTEFYRMAVGERSVVNESSSRDTIEEETAEYIIKQHECKFSYERGFTLQYRILKVSNGSLVWWMREDIFRTGKPELVQLVKEYEKLNQDALEQEGFETSSVYDTSLINGRSNKTQKSLTPVGGLRCSTLSEGQGENESDSDASSGGTTEDCGSQF